MKGIYCTMDNFFIKHFKLLMGGIFTFIGLVILLIGIGLSVHNYNFMKTTKETTAVIEEIRVYHHRDNSSYDVYISYFVEGKEYYNRLNYYSSNMYKGKEITIHYDQNNPNHIVVSNFFDYVLLFFMGLIFSSVGVPFIISYVKDNTKVKRLLKNGKIVEAKIIDFKENTSIAVNGQHPYYLICSDINSPGNIYKSNPVGDSCNIVIGNNIKVYVDMNDKRNYYVDIRDL